MKKLLMQAAGLVILILAIQWAMQLLPGWASTFKNALNQLSLTNSTYVSAPDPAPVDNGGVSYVVTLPPQPEPSPDDSYVILPHPQPSDPGVVPPDVPTPVVTPSPSTAPAPGSAPPVNNQWICPIEGEGGC